MWNPRWWLRNGCDARIIAIFFNDDNSGEFGVEFGVESQWNAEKATQICLNCHY